MWGIATAQQTHRTFELAGKIGKRPVSVLLDSGSTGNFVSAQMCIAQKLKIEKDDYDEELKMADGTTVMTVGRVKSNFNVVDIEEWCKPRCFQDYKRGQYLECHGYKKRIPT